MAEVASAYVSVLPSARGFGKSLDRQVGGDLDKSGRTAGKRWGAGLKTAALAGMAGLALAGVKILSSAVTAASNAQQSMGATEAIFDKFAGNVVKTSDKAAQAFGLSANQYRESANLLGALFKNQGVELDKLSGSTERHVGLAADLSAMYGGPASNAVDAITAAYKGEFNQLEKYGVTLKQSIINTKAETIAKKQYGKALKELTPAQQASAKQLATQRLLFQQTSDAQGAFARESNTLAGQQQRLSAQWDDMKVKLGTKLLPVLTDLASWFNREGLPALQEFGSLLKENKGPLLTIATTVGTFVGVLKLARVAMLLFNGAIRANPFVLLATTVILLYTKFETFRNVVNAVLRTVVRTFLGFVGVLVSGAAKAFGWVPGLGPKLQKAATEFTKFKDKVNNELSGIKNRDVKVRLNAGEVLSQTKSIQSYINGIKGKDVPITISTRPAQSLGGLLGGERAKGGPVSRNTPYLVGEKGPEVFTPDASGRIIPNHKLASSGTGLSGGGGGTYAFTITNWRTGEGYMSEIADRRVHSAASASAEARRAGDW